MATSILAKLNDPAAVPKGPLRAMYNLYAGSLRSVFGRPVSLRFEMDFDGRAMAQAVASGEADVAIVPGTSWAAVAHAFPDLAILVTGNSRFRTTPSYQLLAGVKHGGAATAIFGKHTTLTRDAMIFGSDTRIGDFAVLNALDSEAGRTKPRRKWFYRIDSLHAIDVVNGTEREGLGEFFDPKTEVTTPTDGLLPARYYHRDAYAYAGASLIRAFKDLNAQFYEVLPTVVIYHRTRLERLAPILRRHIVEHYNPQFVAKSLMIDGTAVSPSQERVDQLVAATKKLLPEGFTRSKFFAMFPPAPFGL